LAFQFPLLAHLASAALLAIALRLDLVRAAALALPPFIPPLRPIVAKYCEIALTLSSDGSGSSVASFTVKAAARFGSDGILLKRLMHPVCHVYPNSASLSGSSKMSHHREPGLGFGHVTGHTYFTAW